ncbi:SRPBCC domain-containing protein [Heliobacterium chlorum]|uniref:SRPBCC domain-containing protein n=1 Tax=Heliobacterium chlorum TaxID=2698 RepID=A0ABR7T6E3_HELCL|nr:SRPBCC domain-containing protein [Heliobacterium chlorum]MBC9786349.1 SRPBCC domain-containing protein [Heliobacterium chlorum]
MDLIYEFFIHGEPEQIWNVIVSGQETKKVYFGSEIQSTFEIGSPVKYVGPGLDGPSTVHIHGKVLKYEPLKTFVHSYKGGNAYLGGDPRHKESRVSYTLDLIGSCTKLTLIHDHWSEGDPSYESTKKGWWMLLSSIKSLVETGKPLDFSLGLLHDYTE